jgi:hypothetical protein
MVIHFNNGLILPEKERFLLNLSFYVGFGMKTFSDPDPGYASRIRKTVHNTDKKNLIVYPGMCSPGLFLSTNEHSKTTLLQITHHW